MCLASFDKDPFRRALVATGEIFCCGCATTHGATTGAVWPTEKEVKVATLACRLASHHATHYGGVRETYDTAPFYAPGPYEEWLAAACVQRLELDLA